MNEMRDAKIRLAVVPVAGLGTRLLPVTKSQPKEMLPVGQKPVIQHVVEELAAAGIRRVLFVTDSGKSSIEDHFDINHELVRALREGGKEELLRELEFEKLSVQFAFVRQRSLLGLGHAILCARPFVGSQPFAVALGDTIIGGKPSGSALLRMIECHARTGADAVVALEEVPREDVHRYGIASPQTGGDTPELADIVEKPAPHEAPGNLAVAARYVFSPSVFDALGRTAPGKAGEIHVADALRTVIRRGGKVFGVCLRPGEQRYDIGNFESYFRAFVEFALADEQHGPSLRRHLMELTGENRP
jgi:UTP--glucose-1-phosphate uridylyltransferase